MISIDGKYICCPRTPSGIVLGESGYIHPATTRIEVKLKPKVISDFMSVWNKAVPSNAPLLCNLWDVSISTIIGFNCRYYEAKNCYLFPMVDAVYSIVGIQERYLNGEKRATAGSKLGLFIPDNLEFGKDYSDKCLVICEGLTDTLSVYEDKFFAIGRPSCSTGKEHILYFLGIYNFRKIILMADNDAVGIKGAAKLVKDIKSRFSSLSVKVAIPPIGIKDIRDWRKTDRFYYKNIL